MWEGYDEYSHFALIQEIAFNKTLPDPRTANTSLQVVESLRLAPVPWVIRDPGNGMLSHDDYWRLPQEERKERQRQLTQLPVEAGYAKANPPLRLHEAQQPPLYYWLAAPLLAAARTADLPTLVWVLRCFTVVLASLVVPAAFHTARLIFDSDEMSLGVCLVTASFPELMISVCRVSNEGLAIALGGLVVLLVIRFSTSTASIMKAGCVGLALGAALLTKAYFLTSLPLIGVVISRVWHRNRSETRQSVLQALAAAGICLAVASWWYVRTMALTGSIIGEQTEVAARSGVPLLAALPQVRWFKVLDFLAVSHIWLGNWSCLVVRRWMYRAIEAIWALGAVGLATQIWSERNPLPKRRHLVWLMLPFMTLFVGLCYHAVSALRATGTGGTLAHYLYSFAIPEAVVIVAGIARLLPQRWALLPIPCAVVSLLGLEVFGGWFLLLPYYAGLISHDAAGALPALHLSQLAGGGWGMLLGNLAANKPSFVSAGTVAVAAAAYACAIAAQIWLSVVCVVDRAWDVSVNISEKRSPR